MRLITFIWPRYVNVTDERTDRQTTYCSSRLAHWASRGKNSSLFVFVKIRPTLSQGKVKLCRTISKTSVNMRQKNFYEQLTSDGLVGQTTNQSVTHCIIRYSTKRVARFPKPKYGRFFHYREFSLHT